MRLSRCELGLCTPGVSTSTTFAAPRPGSLAAFFRIGSSRTPRMRFRVVCGLWVTMAIFSPRRAFSRVDLPALGRPTIETNPERSGITLYYARQMPAFRLREWAASNADARDPRAERWTPELRYAGRLLPLLRREVGCVPRFH